MAKAQQTLRRQCTTTHPLYRAQRVYKNVKHEIGLHVVFGQGLLYNRFCSVRTSKKALSIACFITLLSPSSVIPNPHIPSASPTYLLFVLDGHASIPLVFKKNESLPKWGRFRIRLKRRVFRLSLDSSQSSLFRVPFSPIPLYNESRRGRAN